MEESEEPEQPISLERREYRRRRQPSQPMVDKSQQTEITEKRKAIASVQPPAPKATHSIGNIPGSKDNYSEKEYESLRLSSQLQKTWMKRKHVQDMTDKFLQTDPIVEEKVEVIFIDKTYKLEENIAGVGEIAPELPQSIPEVEIPTSRPTSHLIDRSQQTSCTGDWSLIYICPKEKVDKEQQTYFSELEITIRSMPGSSLTKSKEETIPIAQEGSLVEINGSLEIEVLSTEKDPDVMMSFIEGEISGELQALSDGEATVKGEIFLTEETPIQAPSSAEEASAAEAATTTVKDVVDMQAPLADKLSSVETPDDISPPLVQGVLSDKPSDQQYPQGTELAPSELPVEDLVPLSEEVLEKVQALTTDPMLEDSGRAESTTAEETSSKVQYPLSEENSKEVPAEVHFPIAADFEEIAIVIDKKFASDELFEEDKPPIIEEDSTDKATAEVQPPLPEDASEELAPSEVLPPSTEQGTVEDLTAEVLSSPTEAGPTEVPPQPTEEGAAEVPPALTEKGPAEVPPQPTEEGPAEVPPPPAAPTEVPPSSAEEGPSELPPPPTAEGPEEVPPPATEEASAEVQPPAAEEGPVEIPPPPSEEGPAEVPPPPSEEGPAEVPPPPSEESPAEVPPPPAEESPAEVPPPPADEGPEEIPPLASKESPAEVSPPPIEEASAEVSPAPAEKDQAEGLPPQTEESPTHDIPTEVQLPQGKGSPAQVLPSSGETTAEEASAQVQPPSFEKAPLESLPLEEVEKIHLDDLSFEVQPLPTEDIAVGVPAEFQALPADENPAETQPSSFEGAPVVENPVEAPLPEAEADTGGEASAVHPRSLAPTDEAPAEIQILQTDNIPTEVAPVENQPLSAEEVFPKVVPEEEATAAEVRSPLSEGAPAEEASMEAQLTSVEESPKKASVDVQPLPPETPVEESPVVELPLKTDVVTMQEFGVEKMPAEDPVPPSEQTPADEVLLKKHRLSQVADSSEKELEPTALTVDKTSKGTDSVLEDVSGTKDEQISTFKLEGTIKIELKN